jgi:hypothetical protein
MKNRKKVQNTAGGRNFSLLYFVRFVFCFYHKISDMNQTDKEALLRLNDRIDAGEKFDATLLAHYQHLVDQESREGNSSEPFP